MHTPSYSSLAGTTSVPFAYTDPGNPNGDTSTPFHLGAVVPVSFAYWFNVTPGTEYPHIVTQYMASGGAPISLDEPLATLANNGDLFFCCTASGGCWCQYVFKVVPQDSGYALAMLDSGVSDPTGCVVTIPIPADGADLDTDQKVIPSGWSKYYNMGISAVTGLGVQVKNKQRCIVDSATGAHFSFEEESSHHGHYKIVSCSRDMGGYFAWPVRSKWMDSILDKLIQIADPANHRGVAWDVAAPTLCNPQYVHDTSGQWIPPGCTCNLADIIYTLKTYAGPALPANPGCITSEVSTGWPWNAVTCGGETCGDTGKPQVYKETLDQLKTIVDFMDGTFNLATDHSRHASPGFLLLRPYDDSEGGATDTKGGYTENCATAEDPGVITDTYNCDAYCTPGDGPDCGTHDNGDCVGYNTVTHPSGCYNYYGDSVAIGNSTDCLAADPGNHWDTAECADPCVVGDPLCGVDPCPPDQLYQAVTNCLGIHCCDTGDESSDCSDDCVQTITNPFSYDACVVVNFVNASKVYIGENSYTPDMSEDCRTFNLAANTSIEVTLVGYEPGGDEPGVVTPWVYCGVQVSFSMSPKCTDYSCPTC